MYSSLQEASGCLYYGKWNKEDFTFVILPGPHLCRGTCVVGDLELWGLPSFAPVQRAMVVAFGCVQILGIAE
ncbi:hypothetical protein QQP08_011502 [Theobroma cacao]|nr:hypothetical protein QQP08_011502 [Theobroma cacao]